MGYITRCDIDRTSDNSEHNVSRRDFLKVAAGVVGALALGSAILEGLSGSSSNTANATSDSETTANQSAGNNATTSANNGNTDTSAEVSKLKAAINTSGFTLDSTDSEIPQAGGGYSAGVEFTYNGKTYKGIVGTSNNTEYTVEFDSLNFEETGKSLDGARDWIIKNCINKSNS